MNVMRSCLSYGLFKNCLHNFHQGNELGRLFEIGKTFSDSAAHKEHWHLGLMDRAYNQHLWSQKPQHPLIFEVKSTIENLLRSFRISSLLGSKLSNPARFLIFYTRDRMPFSVLRVKFGFWDPYIRPFLMKIRFAFQRFLPKLIWTCCSRDNLEPTEYRRFKVSSYAARFSFTDAKRGECG